MVKYNQVVKGLTNYIDSEILTQITGFKKVALGVASSIAIKKADNIYKLIKDNKIIKTLDIVDKDGNINIDLLKDEIIDQMGEEKYNIDIPMIGTLKINKNDIEKVYDYIIESEE